MSVVIVTPDAIHEVANALTPHDRKWVAVAIEDDATYGAVIIKCPFTHGMFYKELLTTIRQTAGEGFCHSVVHYLASINAEVVYVAQNDEGTPEIVFINNSEFQKLNTDGIIVRVDDSIDAEVVQRAMDKDKWNCEQNEQPYYIKSTIDTLLANGLLSGTYTITNF
ncbi:hypothetical protein MZD04_gp284 [Pseudomonas phage Psa21]|uniref:Uncharacterized protein n=1 Tax=Pseudomonas phage Psa21 TaxID=2530023 RepID=A0A481W4S6_9CAUD|nr:hypothetical protein MZD04_gp284 [Pseudomonas phage Psa21]QBJ02810.1 hypothetical protein PSA21_284 [Pseudomonas phage Psa21]